jgi:hypothetical protein
MTDPSGSSLSEPGGVAPLLTLEPLIEAIREGVEAAGWSLSGLQKTTSHEFEGRWAGDSSRSAYLFFHRADLPGDLSIDVYLDETGRGLSGNLALVVDGRDLGELEPVSDRMEALAGAARARLLEGYPIPVTFRARVDPREPDGVDRAQAEVRFKLRIPRAALKAGSDAVSSLASTAVAAFESLLLDPALEAFRLPPDERD